MTGSDLEDLAKIFETARRLGFLGPRPVTEQIAHSVAFASVLEATGSGPAPFLDLGSGGGVPGLVLAVCWPEQPGTLLDSSRRRTEFLRLTVADLGWEARLAVVEGRAELLARDSGLRASFPLVVARSFAAPSVTAEIGGAFVEPGGRLGVSEPGTTGERNRVTDRWPQDGLAQLGLGPAEVHRGAKVRVAVIPRIGDLADRWPRAVGIPAKRPLW
jgi:16S rRNA (guanine527-N7)-methyltransferase